MEQRVFLTYQKQWIKYNENKMKYIPKADVEMLREDRYEASGNKNQKKYKY